MGKAVDLIGQKFGTWKVLSRVPRKPKSTRGTFWMCVCKCGVTRAVSHGSLCSGVTKSCGCGKAFKHRLCDTPEYTTWIGIKTRCNRKNSYSYHLYGGRGITVCPRWANSFEDFLADVGFKPSPKHSLDRINNNGNYEPGNVRWATQREQANNTRRNHYLTIEGKTKTITEWARFFGFKRNTIFGRLSRKVPIENIFDGLTPRHLRGAVQIKITYKGISKTRIEWARHLNMSINTLYSSLYHGHSIAWIINRQNKRKKL